MKSVRVNNGCEMPVTSAPEKCFSRDTSSLGIRQRGDAMECIVLGWEPIKARFRWRPIPRRRNYPPMPVLHT
jgi:hypothetical protein